jgi:hypothetical protein
MAKKIVQNVDNEHLLPWGNEKFVIGYVESVNGSGAEEVPGFVPTRHELIELVKYWYGRWLGNDYFYFLTGQTGSTENRENPFAARRIDRIQTVLGQETVDRAIAAVMAKFSEGIAPETWNIFLNGDQAQRQAVQERFHEDIEKFHSEIKKAEQQINDALGNGTEAARSMIAFMHEYREGRSPYELGDPIALLSSHASEAEKQRAKELLQILQEKR